MLGLKFQPLLRIGFGFREAITSIRSSGGEGNVSAFKSLTTALAATIGTGNVAGVAGAIAVGGPGAVFWMWLIALVGMATKYAESLLAVHYREVDELGEHVGGPMYFIRNGLGKNWAWMGWLFAFFGVPLLVLVSEMVYKPTRWPKPCKRHLGYHHCSLESWWPRSPWRF